MITQGTKRAATLLVGLVLIGTIALRADAAAIGTVQGADPIVTAGPLSVDVITINNSPNASATQIGATATGDVIVGGGPVEVGGDSSSPPHAFFKNNNAITDLGTLGGTTSTAFGVNASEQVVGQSSIANDAATHAFLYSGGSMHDLGTLGGDFSAANGVNDSARIVGQSVNASGATRAFLDSGGTMTDLGTLGGLQSSAAGINNANQIVGQAGLANGTTHAFLYSGGTMNDLGTLGGSTSFGYGIDGEGAVVGQSSTMGDLTAHAFLVAPGGTMSDLGTLPGFTASLARSINDAGQIVGNSYGKVDPATGLFLQHAFVYDHGTLVDLNTLLPAGSGWVLTEAMSINDDGLVVGIGRLNGHRQAFALNVDGVASVPEPTTIVLFGLVMIGAGVRMIGHRTRR